MSVASHPVPNGRRARISFWPGSAVGALPLAHDEIHVWHQSLARGPAEVADFRSLLSPDELQRADRFRFDRDRNRFIVSRGTLRTLLGSYLNRPPEELRFDISAYGRPTLATEDSGSERSTLTFHTVAN